MQAYARKTDDSGGVSFEPVTAEPVSDGFGAAALSIAQSYEAIQRMSPPRLDRARSAVLPMAARLGGAERRSLMRLPFCTAAQITIDGAIHDVRTRDIGLGGMLLERPPDFITAQNRTCEIEAPGLGRVLGELVAINFATLSVRFTEQSASTLLDRLPALMKRLNLRNLAALAEASRMAEELENALTGALLSGVLQPGALFAPPSAPIIGSDPQQRSHPASAVLSAILPPLLRRYWRTERGVAYAVAVNRHGYVPVHNEPFAKDQKPGEPVHNHNLSRHARIYDDLWTQCAARVSTQPIITVEERDVAPRFGQVVRAASAPITVLNRRWGAARIAWVMRDDLALSSSAECAEPSPA
jgi:methyl-accepting chemotaxis protein